MKKQFLIISAFVFAMTSGILQADSNPTMSRVYGNQFTPQVANSQLAATVGTLDTTFDSDGILSINGVLGGSQGTGIQALPNGDFLVAASLASDDSVVAKYSAEAVLQTAYGSSGIAALGTSNQTEAVLATMLDTQGRILVAGGSTTGWIARLSTDGQILTTFTAYADNVWTNIGGLAQQTTGHITAVGLNKDGTPHAQLARYNLDGTIHTTFGSSGYVVLDGSGALPNVETGLVSIVINASDKIYIAFIADTTANGFTANNAYIARFDNDGALDTSGDGSWPVAGFVALSDLDNATSGLYVARNENTNLIISAQVSPNVVVTGITVAGVAVAGFPFNTSTISGNTFIINNLMTTSDNGIFVIGSDSTGIDMAVIKLTAAGILDTGFNTTGYNLFNLSSPDTTALLNAATVAHDGQIYAAGYQVNGATTVPYVSRLNNTQYVSQAEQHPRSVEQGILDRTFGTLTRQTYPGVTTPFNGLYGSSMMQRATSIIEVTAGSVTAGNMLVGMNGFTNDNNISQMMFGWLNSTGTLDTTTAGGTIPASGYLTLDAASGSVNEYLNTMVEDSSGNVYIAGYTSSSTSPTAPGNAAATSATIRVYSDFTDSAANSSASEAGSGYQGVGLALQGATRSLLCVAESATVGHISGYTGGALDGTFGSAGIIASTAYGLNMGPCYGLLVAGGDEIYAAYVNSVTPSNGQVDLAAFVADGSSLVNTFGSSGIVADLFDYATYTVDSNNVRVGFREATTTTDDIVVAATATKVSDGNQYLLVASLDPITGALSLDFNGGAVLAIDTDSLGTESLQLTRVTGIADGAVLANGKLLLTFWDDRTDDALYLARIIADGTSLDTSFNSQGTLPGILPVQIGDEITDYTARTATCALVQSTAGDDQGNIVMAGYQSVTANDSTPMIVRSYGTLGTTEIIDFPVVSNDPGTFDTSFDLATAPVISAGSGNVVFTYPAAHAQQGKLLIGIDNGTSSVVARVYASNMNLDTTFAGDGIYTVAGPLPGIKDISIDADSNILIGGASGGAGWAQRLNDAGSSAISFDMATTASDIAAVNQIYQQKSGRYIISGTQITSGNGILVAFQDEIMGGSTFAVDPTFNPLSFGSVTYAGSYYVGTTGLYTMAINTNDTIVVAYADGTPKVVLTEIAADGNGLAAGFNSGVAITTTLDTDASSVIRVNIDNSGRVIVATSYSNTLLASRYSAAGVLDTGGFGTAGITTLSDVGTAGVVLTEAMATSASQTVMVGYNTDGSSKLFASRLDSAGVEDTTWNSGASLKYDADSATQVLGGAIAVDGTVFSICAQATGTSGDPIITLVYGDSYVSQSSQNPLEAAAGTLDLTIPGSASGALALASTLTGVPQKLYIYNSTINSSPNGAMLAASVAADQYVYVTQLNADLTVNSANFGTTGVVTLDLGAGNAPTVTDMYIANDTSGDPGLIYVTGYTRNATENTAFVARILSDGSSSTIASPVSALTATTTSPVSGGVRQSSNSRVLVSGYNGSFGQIVAYNSEMTAIDTSFGNGIGTGYYTTATDSPIVAMTIDTLDRIYIAYKSAAGVVTVERLLENGTAIDTDFSASFITAVTGYSATQIKMAIDLTNSQLIVAAQDGTSNGNIVQLARFALVDGTANGAISTILVSGAVLELSDLFIDNNTTVGGLYPNVYVAGYISSGTGSGNSVIARVASSSSTVFALDSTYGVSGIANLTIGSSTMSVVTAAALDPDRRVYLVGSNGSTTAYMGRFFGDYYWNERYPAIDEATIGSVDTTLSPTGAATGVAGIDLVTEIAAWSSLAGYTARAVIENQNADGTSFIAFGNGTSLIVGKVDADMNAVSYGTAGLTTALAMATVNSMTQDADGNIIVVGTTAAPIQKIVSFDTSGVLNATFAAPTIASSAGTAVAQQKSGRYIVGGRKTAATSYAMISAYKNESAIDTLVLPVDDTFGPAGLNGYYLNTAAAVQIDDLCIDSNDFIYYVYRGGSNEIYVGKLTANGSGICTDVRVPAGDVFNTTGADVATGITATQPARIAINSAGNILVGASTSTGVSTRLYTSIGGAVSVALEQTISNTPVLTQLVGAGASAAPGAGTEFYGSYYNSATTQGGYVFAVTNTGILDTSFNSGAVLELTGQTPSLTAGIKGLSVQADGKVVAVGYNDTNPILMRAYAYPYVAEFAQAPDQVDAGILDTTLWESGVAATDGIFPFDNIDAGLATAIDGMGIVRVFEDGNGIMTFVATNATDTVVFRLLKDLALDTSLNTVGYISFGGYPNANSLYINSLGNIFVAGNDGGSWVWGMASDGGDISPNFAPGSNLNPVYQVAQQSHGRVIIAGLTDGGNGTLIGYTSTGALDNSFGSGGSVDMGATIAITDITIDEYNNIIAVSNNSGTVVLQKVTSSGLTVTNVSGNGTAITGAVGNIKVILDETGDIVVSAATATGYITRNYVNDNGTPGNTGNDIGVVAITTGTTPVLSNTYATTGDKVNLIGYDSNNGAMVVARLTSTSSSLVLDTASFNASTGYLSTLVGDGTDMDQFLDGIIHADDRMMVVGSNSGTEAPYMTRVFGDEYYVYVGRTESHDVAGTLDTTFGDTDPPTGIYHMSTLNALLAGAQGKSILPLSNGGYYMAVDLANSLASSILLKTVADGSLDTAYNTGGSVPGIAGTDTGTYAPLGVNSILEDGLSKVLLVGTTGGAGWLRRYTSAGVKDTDFGTAGAVAVGTSATVAVEQTPARYVVAGGNGSGGALFAFTAIDPSSTPGSVDVTFNSVGLGATTGGTTPGIFLTNTTNSVYTVVADLYDRLIYAVLNDGGTAVDLYRLTPSGQYDWTFGTSGKVTGAIATAADASSVRVALDAAGNIVVAANSSTSNTFSVRAFDNGIGAGAGDNGAAIYAQLDIASLTGPSVTGLITSADGYALVLGTQSGTGAAWIARITAGGLLDTTAFNPAAIAGVAGIFQYSAGGGDTAPAHVYSGLAVNANGTLGMVGYETTTGPVYTPTLVAVYDNPFTSQESQSPNSKAVGSNDATLGVGAADGESIAVDNGVTFFGNTVANAASGQVAEAIALYDDNNLVVAMNGGAVASDSTYSGIFINMFNNDGLLNPNFGTAGQATVLTGSAAPSSPNYQNQYVSDMVTYSTVSGVHKAIIAGYTYNSALPTANQYSSLLLQYNLIPGGTSGLDTANFGGFNGSPQGIAFGDAKKAFSVAQQSTGRIIVAGLSQNDLGVLLGYTSAGKLDTSFGVGGGYQVTDTGSTGIYSHAVDTENRIVIVYDDGSDNAVVSRFLADGSALDATFDASASYIADVTSESNMKVAIDSSNNVIVAAITLNTNNFISVSSYDAADGSETVADAIDASDLGNASAVYTISKVLIDTEDNVIVVAYDTNAQKVVVVRLTSSLVLDTTFNAYDATLNPSGVVGGGYINYIVADGTTSQAAKDAMIHPDGRIIVVGSEI